MANGTGPPAAGAEELLARYGDLLYRLCFLMLGNEADTEDAVQEAFLQYLRKAPRFASADHERAWLITTAKNKSRDILRARRRHPVLEAGPAQAAGPAVPGPEEGGGIVAALMTLPEKFRLVLVLHYVEGYPVKDIARMLQRTPSAVKMRLQKGRRLLEQAYRKEEA